MWPHLASLCAPPMMCDACAVPQAEGFSEAIIDRFFRPFLGGIFFNTQLTTSSRWDWQATQTSSGPATVISSRQCRSCILQQDRVERAHHAACTLAKSHVVGSSPVRQPVAMAHLDMINSL